MLGLSLRLDCSASTRFFGGSQVQTGRAFSTGSGTPVEIIISALY